MRRGLTAPRLEEGLQQGRALFRQNPAGDTRPRVAGGLFEEPGAMHHCAALGVFGPEHQPGVAGAVGDRRAQFDELFGERLGLEGGFWSLIAALNDDLADFGFVVIGVFALAWVASAAIYRFKGYERIARA